MTRNPAHNDTDPNGIIGLIAGIRERANLLIEDELKARGIAGIVPAHGPVLHFLFNQSEPVPIKSLVDRIGRVKSTVTGIVSTLEKHGYLFRQACGEDGRSVRIGLTDKGRALRGDFEEISRLLLERVYGNMVLEDRQRLAELLGVIRWNMDL